MEGNWRYFLQTDSICMSSTVFLIKKIPSVVRDPAIIDMDDVEQFTWIEPLQKVIEERLNEPDNKTIWLYSSRIRNNGALGTALCFV